MAQTKILLVDDDMEDYLIMKSAFSDLGADESLVYANSGITALSFLEKLYSEAQPPFDLIVLDINMPQMDGPAVLKAIRDDERFRNIPVVIYSTSVNPQAEEQCSGMGVEYFITKPHSLEEIIRVGESLLALSNKRDPLVTPDIS